MKILRSGFDFNQFYQDLEHAMDAILFLDYDGTLAPFHTDPAKAFPYPELVGLLEQLIENPRTRTIFVSGRTVEDLIALLPFKRLPEIWGCHGFERLDRDQRYSKRATSDDFTQLIAQLENLVRPISVLGGRYERKTAGIAVHWRGCDEPTVKHIRQFVIEKFQQLAQNQFELHEFDGGLEFRLGGVDKAAAVHQVLDIESGSNYVAAYLGDDRTDEDAFRAMKGKGLSVLVREQLRPTLADVWIKPPDELGQFFQQWLQLRTTSNERKSNAISK